MAVLKTGVILTKRREPSPDFLTESYQQGSLPTVYGDLHLIGNCGILYYPQHQVAHGASHGWIDLDEGYDCWVRHTSPCYILVIPAKRIVFRRAALYHTDIKLWETAGGVIDDTPGEMG